MSIVTIGYTNISLEKIILPQLNNSLCLPGATALLSNTNLVSNVLNSSQLYSAIENDLALVSMDGADLSKEESLRMMNIYRNASKENFSLFKVTGARNGNSSLDRDLKLGDVFYNQTPEQIPFDCILVAVTAGTRNAETWEAHVYKDDVSAYSLSITTQPFGFVNDLNEPFPSGSKIRLRAENSVGSINSPRITAWFKIINT